MALNNMGLGFHVSAKDDASPALESVTNKLAGTKKAAEKAKVSFEDIGSEMGGIGSKFKMAGLAGAVGIGLAVNESMKFGTSVAEVASITTRAAFPISEIERIGKEMAATYGGDLNQQVKALYQAASSGAADAAEANVLMHQANQLAVGGLSDSFKAIDALTNVLNAYGMKMTEAQKVSDAMFVTAKVGKTTIDELASQIGRVAPTAASVGVSLDDMMSVIAAASGQLGNGTAAVDGLKEALANIVSPSKEAQDEAKRLGIKFDAAALRAQGFDKFLKSITQNAKFNADTIGHLFGSMTAYNLMSALASNNSKGFTDALAAMKDKSGATEAAFKTLAETGTFAATVFKSNLQVALTDIGNVIAPTIGEVVKFANALLIRFNKAPASVKKVVAGLLVFVTVTGLVVGGLLGVVSAIAAAAAAGEVLLIAVAAAAGLLLQFVVMAAAAAAVLYVFKRAYEENLGGFRDFIDETYKKVKLAWDALVQVFSDGGFSGSVLTELNKAENQGIKAFAIQAFLWFNRVKEFFEGIGRGFSAAMATLGPAFSRLITALKDIGKMLGITQDKPWEAAAAFRAFGETGERVGGILGNVVEFIVDGFTNVAKFVGGVIEAFQAMRKIGAPLTSAFGSVFDSFVKLGEALGLVSKGGSANGDMWKSLGQIVGLVVGGIVNAIAGMVNAFAVVVSVVASLAGGVIGMFQGLWNMLAGFIQFFTAVFQGRWSDAWQGMARMVYGVVQFLLNLLNGFVGSILSVVDKVAGAFGKKTNLAGALTAEKDSLLNSTQDGLGLINATGGKDRSALFATGAAQPATVPVAQNAANAAAAANAPPIQTTAVTTVVLDGEKVGEAVAKHQAGNAARTPGAPIPAPA